MAITAYNPAASLVLMGLSTDTKPTSGIAPGTRFLQTDNGAVFMFYNTGAWVQVALIAQSAWNETGIAISL